ncbi:hypothetical protein BK666_02230 [Pseudomonas frederiksbergensis]|uniref:Phage tail protein n=1 Tax=Pseudomonas frederiksbergensis TaxID=104087 RepID=A0A423KIJ1_9PSED|nr:hypothetical protein [Pseudomonas frederiksbergensis]RON52936.1 hypothetical protein BK666_02230 [Pseudomonas frederiksbergensis]
MYQIDNSTAAATIPASTAAGTAGFFTDGNPATGVAATIMPAEYQNMLMMEVINVLNSAGVTPSKAVFTQLTTAIKALAQQGTSNSTTDTGSANTIVASLAPVVATLVDQMVVKVLIAAANTGATTLNLNGLGARSVVGLGATALQGGELAAGGRAAFVWAAAQNSWILLYCQAAASQVSPATKSQHAPQFAQVQSNAANYAVDGGIVNAVAVNLAPIPTALTDGMLICFKPKFTNTGATTISVNGLTAIPLVGQGLGALQGGELLASGRAIGIYSSTSNAVQLLMCAGGSLQVGAASQSSHAVQLSQVGHGQCRLSVNSTTQLKLLPYNGNNLIINGVPQSIPGAGITISNASLAASTLYYVYVFMSSGTMTLELSATGHATGTTGIEQKTGDTTRTFVGMIYTNASSQFVDTATQKFCLNWFNRRGVQAINTFAANRTTTSASFVELSSTERAQFLAWSDEAILISTTGYASQNTVGTFGTQGNLDGTTPVSNARISPPVGQDSACGSSGPVFAAEGVHYATIFGFATAGFTATWTAGINSINVSTRG